MGYAARIVDGIVVEIAELSDGTTAAAAFHPDAGFVDASEVVALGMRYVNGEFLPPIAPEPPSDAERKAALTAFAADLRWRREVGGITVAGVPVATDDRAKMMIVGARVAAMADPQWSTIWHGADGDTYPVDAAAMLAISDAVQAHVNQGFASFAQVKAAIEAGTITTKVEVEAALA